MTAYLLFADQSRRPLSLRLADCCERYRERFGAEPSLCLVSESEAEAAAESELTVRTPEPGELVLRAGMLALS